MKPIKKFLSKQKKRRKSKKKKTKRFSSVKKSQKKNGLLKKLFPGPKIEAGSWHAKHPRLVAFLHYAFLPFTHPILRIFSVSFILLSAAGLFYLSYQLPNPRMMVVGDRYDVSTQIFDRNEELLYEIYSDVNRIPVKLEDLPDHTIQATIAIEDKRFYRHLGLDLEGIGRALLRNIRQDQQQGGSTITQQLVKNALLTPEKSITRKIKEAVLAVMTEVVYSKDEILEMYLNYISYGGTSVGIEAASQAYFNKPARELTLEESALLAGLPQAPTRYSPFGSNPEQAKARQADVLRRMVEDEYISSEEARKAQEETLNYAISATEIKAPHFVFFVRDMLYEEYGVDKVERGGLRVYTTLDLQLQQQIQQIVGEEIDKLAAYRVSNGAAIVTKPDTGEILAMIGSRDYFDTENDGQVNVTIAHRQPGSAIKPVTYATAFQEKTLNPGTLLIDEPTCFLEPFQPAYCPRNYDGGFRGPVTVRQSLGNSFNIPAVKAQATIGVHTLMAQAQKMGIQSWREPSQYGMSLTLGGGEVKMTEMAQSFGVLANQGVLVPLTPILRIENYRGEVIKETEVDERLEDLDNLTHYDAGSRSGELQRVMDRAPAYLVSHILQDNQARAMIFGTHSQLVIPNHVVSAKTGTTNDMKDNWTIGYTPQYLVATWVGNNDGSSMGWMVSGIMGAAPMFNQAMTQVLNGRETIWQERPDDVVLAGVCASGMPPALTQEPCGIRGQDLYWEKGLPSKSRFVQENVWIDPETGQPPPYGEEVDGLVLEERIILEDPVTASTCYDCEVAHDEEGNPIRTRTNVNIRDSKAIVD